MEDQKAEKRTLGEIAYMAYGAAIGAKPRWKEELIWIRAAWEAVALAIGRHVLATNERKHTESAAMTLRDAFMPCTVCKGAYLAEGLAATPTGLLCKRCSRDENHMVGV